ncbi:MAG TPA: SPOR domain-containing protein [Vicinamibacterales bacterium]|nr:SPOR domain-containing protein [Vicinamibacterales bacterium]
MADLSQHETGDDGFHEIQLSGKQLVFLFMATTVVSVVIFLCGVLVGRNVKTEAVVDAAEPMALAAAPANTAPPAVPLSEAGPPAAEPPTPAKDDDEDLSYHKRLESDTPPPEKLKMPSAGSAASARGPAPSPKGSASRSTATTSVPARPPAAEALGAARPGVWVVQLVALKDRRAAAGIVHRLSAKGYPAFVVAPSSGAPSIFRVQVGRYNDRHEAEQVARRLEKEEQFKPWISH